MALEKDESNLESQPFLEAEYDDNHKVKSHRPQKSLNNSPSKWLIGGLILPYIPMIILCIALYLRTTSPTHCSNDQHDIFPCEKLASLASKKNPLFSTN